MFQPRKLDLKEASRIMRLWELRLRTAAIDYTLGIGSRTALSVAAESYGRAALDFKKLEQQALELGDTDALREAECQTSTER